MSFTESQRAYHLRKMRTRMVRLDVNKDGYISREDYELMGKRLAEYGEMTQEQAESTHRGFMKVADALNLKPGVKLPLEEYAQNATGSFLSKTPDAQKALVDVSHNPIFDIIDINKDGHISVEEFKAYMKVIAPDCSEEDVDHAFKAIDADHNGEISREEFLAAAEDFFMGVEKTELSKVFMGKLID